MADHTTTKEPPPIRQLSAPELLACFESGTLFERVDVRTEKERACARIDSLHNLLGGIDARSRLVDASVPRH